MVEICHSLGTGQLSVQGGQVSYPFMGDRSAIRSGGQVSDPFRGHAI